jgi:hypothetical protein
VPLAGASGSQCSEPRDRVGGRPASLRCPMTQPDPDLWPHVLSTIAAGTSLDRDEAAAAMRAVMSGEATPAQVGGLLMALRTKGETVEEIEGLADTMLGFANAVVPPDRSWTPAGPAGIEAGRSTSRRSLPWSLRAPASPSPSTATGPRRPSAARQTCSRRSASGSTSTRPGSNAAWPRPGSHSSSRRCSTPRWVTRARFAASSASQPSSISSAR